MTVLAITMLVLGVFSFVNTGVFLAFTTMVTPALAGARDPGAASDVMRDMNVRAPRSIFMVSFLGAPLAAVVAGVLLVMTGGGAAAGWAIAAIAATLAAFIVSVAVNIPWNERLLRESGHGVTWTDFSRIWGRANTVRSALSLLAGASALVAIL
ncbi:MULTISPECIES: anthrone oxygenase family protein [Microbacterium]|uniref:anthrone oxygenase family protein n=1 Tax=Microbacterium TaxID=33882 RepID=UPI000D651C5C|nr:MULTISPECIES: anthrone oxygenase family protein [Microbacterium]